MFRNPIRKSLLLYQIFEQYLKNRIMSMLLTLNIINKRYNESANAINHINFINPFNIINNIVTT